MAGGCVIGVDLGGTKVLGGAVAEDGSVSRRMLRRLPDGLDGHGVIELLVDLVAGLQAAGGRAVEAVAVGIPAAVDVATGTAGACPHLPLAGLAVRDLLSERLGLPVAVDNDATCATVAEHRLGAARGAGTAALLTVGTGIGGGIVAGGEVMRGASGAAGEWGHMCVDVGGRECSGDCPGRGCLETVVCGPALAEAARSLVAGRPGSPLASAASGGRALDGALVTELAHDGDGDALTILREMGALLGVGITNIVNALNPEVVVVGGGVMAAGELLLAPAREVVAVRALRPAREQVRIVATHFGEEAGMVGAGLIAHDLAGRA